MGIEVLPPDINESVLDFRGVEGRIRFGLNAVKNVGETAIRNILEARAQDGPFRDLFDFCERVDLGVVNGRALESLIKSGALDSIGPSRRGMLAGAAAGHGPRQEDPVRRRPRPGLDLRPADEPTRRRRTRPESGGANGSRSNGHPPVEIPDEDFSKEELLALEKETLGLYVSSHPLKDMRHQRAAGGRATSSRN